MAGFRAQELVGFPAQGLIGLYAELVGSRVCFFLYLVSACGKNEANSSVLCVSG